MGVGLELGQVRTRSWTWAVTSSSGAVDGERPSPRKWMQRLDKWRAHRKRSIHYHEEHLCGLVRGKWIQERSRQRITGESGGNQEHMLSWKPRNELSDTIPWELSENWGWEMYHLMGPGYYLKDKNSSVVGCLRTMRTGIWGPWWEREGKDQLAFNERAEQMKLPDRELCSEDVGGTT